MKLTFLGHSAFLIETESHKLLIDPFLTGNPKAVHKAADLTCDAILLTHGHEDHFGDTLEIAKRCDATVIATAEIATYCAARGCKAHPLNLGGGAQFPFGRVELTVAFHSSSLAENGGESFTYLGDPGGILLTTDSHRIYHAGDTALFSDMKLIGAKGPLDVALLPVGDNFTMGVTDALEALSLLEPRKAVPIHYDTFPYIETDVAPFVRGGKERGVDVRVLQPGESLTLE